MNLSSLQIIHAGGVTNWKVDGNNSSILYDNTTERVEIEHTNGNRTVINLKQVIFYVYVELS